MSFLDGLRGAIRKWLAGAGEDEIRGRGVHRANSQSPLEIVQLARQYIQGEQPIALTERQQEWLERHRGAGLPQYRLNACSIVIAAYLERLGIRSVGVMGSGEIPLTAEALLAQFAIPESVFKELLQAVLVDGVAFLFTDYIPGSDAEPAKVQYMVERLAVPEEYGGDGEGIVPVVRSEEGQSVPYPAEFYRLWREEIADPRTNGQTVIAEFRRLYGNGVIATWIRLPGEHEWAPWPDAEQFTMPWLYEDSETGIGIPLPPPISAWFLPRMETLLRDVIPIQAMLDKVWLNTMMASDWLGAGLMAFIGWVPTTDGKPLAPDRSNLLRPVSGDYIFTARKPSEADLRVVFPTTVEQLLDLESRLTARLSAISGVPLSAFVSTGQVASEKTLKQQEAALLARVRGIQEALSIGVQKWAESLLAQVAAFGASNLEDWRGIKVVPVWKDPQMRNEAERVEIAERKVRSLGIDPEQVWREDLGYTPEQVEELRKSVFAQALRAEANARLAQAEQITMLGRG